MPQEQRQLQIFIFDEEADDSRLDRITTQVAKDVLRNNFKGTYTDVNAISPQRSLEICDLLEKGGINLPNIV